MPRLPFLRQLRCPGALEGVLLGVRCGAVVLASCFLAVPCRRCDLLATLALFVGDRGVTSLGVLIVLRLHDDLELDTSPLAAAQ